MYGLYYPEILSHILSRNIIQPYYPEIFSHVCILIIHSSHETTNQLSQGDLPVGPRGSSQGRGSYGSWSSHTFYIATP